MKNFIIVAFSLFILIGCKKSNEDEKSLPEVSTEVTTDVTTSTATVSGNISDEGNPKYTECGVCYSLSAKPTVDDTKKTASKTGLGSFTVDITSLNLNTKYYIKAYAINSQGIAYGEELSFTTKNNIAFPSITTQSTVTNITNSTADVGGNIRDLGNPAYSERGICYATSPNPTIENSKNKVTGSGTGDFNISLSGLTPDTKYYIKAYAINSQGVAYGEEVSFTTSKKEIVEDNISLLDNSIDPNSQIVEYKMSAEQYKKLINKADFGNELVDITKQIYSKFNDDFDFIFYVLDKPQSEEILSALEFYAVNMGVSNAVQGIGKVVYQQSTHWGSANKLKSVMYFPMYDAIQRGPSLHEICHNWAASICPTYGLDGTPYEGHWGVSNAGGQLGGFKNIRTVEKNSGGVAGKTLYQASFSSDKNSDGSFTSGFGTVANGGNAPLYSDIELYTMGMKSAQDLRNANFKLDIYLGCSYDNSTAGLGYFWATGVKSYTIDDLIALNGPRIPDVASSQKSFKVLTVVLTEKSATEHHYRDIITGISWLSGPIGAFPSWPVHNFKEATGGVGSLVTSGVKGSMKSTQSTYLPVAKSSSYSLGKIHIDKLDKNLLYLPK